MKNLSLLIVGLVVFSLLAFDSHHEMESIKGDGHVITTSRSVSPFEKIKIEGVFNIYFIQGNEEMVEVETDENLQDYVSVKTKDNTLYVSTNEDDIEYSTKNNIFITLKNINSIDINSVGKIECKTVLVLERLTLDYDGVGKTVLNLDCGQFNADIASVGSLTIKGKAKSANIEHAGVGSVNAFDFKVEYLSLNHSGIGSVEAFAIKELSITSSGIGSVRFKGPAEIKKLETSGLGSVKRAD